MIVFLVLVGLLVGTLHRRLWEALLTSPGFNVLICCVLLSGILFSFQQVLRLYPEIRWVNAFRISDPGLAVSHRPVLLAPMATMLRNQTGPLSQRANSLRTILNSIGSRLDEAHTTGRYLAGLMLFLGLLGSSWGFVTDPAAAQRDWASTFSPALLGAAGWLVLGFLQLQAGHAFNRFYDHLEEWLSAIDELAPGEPRRSRYILSGRRETSLSRPEPRPLGSKVFISYRRTDTRHIAGRIYDRLARELSADEVFLMSILYRWVLTSRNTLRSL